MTPTSPPSKAVAPSAVELLQLADQQAYMRARYNEEDSGLIRESRVIEWALRQAATPAVGMREALANAIDSPTVAALAKVFDPRHQRPDKCYSEQIVEILSAALQSVQPPAGEDCVRIDWLESRIVDTVYLDDGKIIDVRGGNLREAIDAAKLKWPNSLEDDDGDEKPVGDSHP